MEMTKIGGSIVFEKLHELYVIEKIIITRSLFWQATIFNTTSKHFDRSLNLTFWTVIVNN